MAPCFAMVSILAQSGRADGDWANPWAMIASVAFVIVALVFLVMLSRLLNLWLQSRLSGAGIGFAELVGMTLRKVDARTIVLYKIRAKTEGISVATEDLVRHCLAGGRVDTVVSAMIAAQRAGVEMSFRQACDIDLAGGDVLKTLEEMTSGDLSP